MSDSSRLEDSKCLEDLINLQFCYSVFPEGTNARFIPEGHLDSIIDRVAVILEFFGDKNYQVSGTENELVNYVVRSAKKLFTIMLICGFSSTSLKKAMMQFKDRDFGDSSLPLRGDITEYPECFKSWSDLRKTGFQREQWSLFAPVFPRELKRLDLEPGQVLPITRVASQHKEGFFGSVYQVTIHSAHQEEPMLLFDGTPADAAIKELKPSARGDEQREAEWRTEAESLERASRLGHKHIVPVKAIITKGPLKYFMFKWADGGNLRDFLERQQPVLTASFVAGITRQLAGLAGALRELHNYQGQESVRHGDLKPENILIFKDETQTGLWTVADMGLAKHHPVPTAVRGPTSTRYATPAYEAPEVKTHKSAGRSRLYDIWSMGCVTLELITWLLYGYGKLDEFNRRLATHDDHPGPYYLYDKDRNTAEVHPEVTKFIDQLREDPKCQDSRAIRDLLGIVSTKLLVVPLPPNRQTFYGSNANLALLAPTTDPWSGSTPRTDPAVPAEPVTLAQQKTRRTRATADDFCKALLEVQEKGDIDGSYWFAAAQPTAVPGPSSALQLSIRPPTPTICEPGTSEPVAPSDKKVSTI